MPSAPCSVHCDHCAPRANPGPIPYERTLVVVEPPAHDPAMKKRALAAVLWLYAGWFLGAAIAWATGAPSVLGPILGLAGAGFFGGDPLHIIWARAAQRPEASVAERQRAE